MALNGEGMVTYLAARVVPEIVPVHLELGMVVHMHKLVHDGVRHVPLAHELPLTEQYSPGFWAESARASEVARNANDVI